MAEVVNGFQLLIFSQESIVIAVRHNPKFASGIFVTILTAVLLDCLKQTKFLEQLFFKIYLRI